MGTSSSTPSPTPYCQNIKKTEADIRNGIDMAKGDPNMSVITYINPVNATSSTSIINTGPATNNAYLPFCQHVEDMNKMYNQKSKCAGMGDINGKLTIQNVINPNMSDPFFIEIKGYKQPSTSFSFNC